MDGQAIISALLSNIFGGGKSAGGSSMGGGSPSLVNPAQGLMGMMGHLGAASGVPHGPEGAMAPQTSTPTPSTNTPQPALSSAGGGAPQGTPAPGAPAGDGAGLQQFAPIIALLIHLAPHILGALAGGQQPAAAAPAGGPGANRLPA